MELKKVAVLLHLAALVLLLAGGALEVGGFSFWGLDLLVGCCFGAALAASVISALVGSTAIWSLLVAGVACVALVLHIWMNISS